MKLFSLSPVTRGFSVGFFGLIALTTISYAGKFTWAAHPVSSDWNTADNWVPTGIPNGPTDTAVFSRSTVPSVTLSGETQVRGISFTARASAFTITVPEAISLSLVGRGINNTAGVMQSFILEGGTLAFDGRSSAGANCMFTLNGAVRGAAPSAVEFSNTASAGSSTFISNAGVSGGHISFSGASTAGEGSFTGMGGSTRNDLGALTQFFEDATAGAADFVVLGSTGPSGRFGGLVEFYDTTSAGSATFTVMGSVGFRPGGGIVAFYNNSSAGEATFFNTGHSGGETIGATDFHDTSTAEQATFNLSDIGEARFYDSSTAASATINASQQGIAYFYGNSSAGESSITAYGKREGETVSGSVVFNDSSTAGNATITLTPGLPGDVFGGRVTISDSASFGNATVIAEGGEGGAPGGHIFGLASASGGSARLELLGNSSIDISALGDDGSGTDSFPLGSLEGSGDFSLGQNKLIVGSNGLSTVFSGILHDGGAFGGTMASVTKVGSGILILTGANTYTGPTNVQAGILGGTNCGNGALTVGTDTAVHATLSPGSDLINPATIIATGALTFRSDGIYACDLQADPVSSDSVTAAGITIENGAVCNLTDLGGAQFSPGTIFTILHDSSAGPINGTFSNIPDGAVVTVGGNNLLADYHGGTGNNLTLTVVE